VVGRAALIGLIEVLRGNMESVLAILSVFACFGRLVKTSPGARAAPGRRNEIPCLVFVSLLPSCAFAAVHYVDVNSSTPLAPYLSWATAATNIQDAVDVASAGEEVVVTNGVYNAGGRAVSGTMTNRVAVDRPLFLHSVNGAQSTTIQGYRPPGSGDAVGAMRCVYLTNGATLSGFTLTNGATSYVATEGGGGAFCETAAVISNCTICGNSATWFGGGVVGGSLTNCILQGNTGGMGGGTYASTLFACTVMSNTASSGGGVRGGILNNSILIGNYSADEGGGASADYGHGVPLLLNDCLILSNTATARGGGVSGFSSSGDPSCNSCTIVGNASSEGGGIWMTNGSMNNCIIYYNTAPSGSNWNIIAGPPQNHCCTTPAPFLGVGSITNAPLFIDLAGGNLRLQSNSPCINTGDNALVVGSTDLDGHPRIIFGLVDMGAYEFVPSPSMRIAPGTRDVTLAWPLWASNFVAQEALGLNAAGWSNVSALVTQTANENVVTISSANAAQFFRLFLP
jgi:hypothetical protein